MKVLQLASLAKALSILNPKSIQVDTDLNVKPDLDVNAMIADISNEIPDVSSKIEILDDLEAIASKSNSKVGKRGPNRVKPSIMARGLVPGKMTYYYFNGGIGSCGRTHAETEMVVAVRNPKCGQKVAITGPDGKTVRATVVDTCPSCDASHIDATVGVWQALGINLDKGVVPVSWTYV
jgi:hypothetical protein